MRCEPENIVAVLSNHIYKEDHILFALCERTLSALEDCEVVRQMEEFDRTLPPKLIQEWSQTVNRLEWKYLNKVA
jgi:hemerythrin-like domain-containing protein